jgi:non-ribosomal peptide synthetase component E (peptide arylation enzyme)
MAAFNKFNSFVEALAEKSHNLGSDQLTIALTAAADTPVAADTVLADQTEISYTNLSTRNVTTASSAQTSGIYKLTCTDLVLTASGGAVASFRFVVLYNNTATNDELIGWWDYGSTVTLANTETFTIDFDGTNGVLTIA